MKYYNNDKELTQHLDRLNMEMCPHCKQFGFLICHGFLTGYSEHGSEKIVRGRRIFCSNRFLKSGCGRTYSVTHSKFIYGHVVTATILWQFFLLLLKGFNPHQSWKQAGHEFSSETGYRFYRKMLHAQINHRTLLLTIRPPPLSDTKESFLHLIEHFQECFPSSSCPFSQFQYHFQKGLV